VFKTDGISPSYPHILYLNNITTQKNKWKKEYKINQEQINKIKIILFSSHEERKM
jgi:hypothetical protein